jgi:hypothetical protein
MVLLYCTTKLCCVLVHVLNAVTLAHEQQHASLAQVLQLLAGWVWRLHHPC